MNQVVNQNVIASKVPFSRKYSVGMLCYNGDFVTQREIDGVTHNTGYNTVKNRRFRQNNTE